MTATRRRVPFRRGEIVIDELGEGPTVGYIHGLVGNPSGQPIIDAMAAAGFHVVAPSLPGFSGSTPCEDLRSMHDWVVAASEVIDLAGLTGSPVVASSVGAMVAFELAAVRPESFSSIVALAPMGLWNPDEPIADPFATTLTNQRAILTVDPASTASFFDDDSGLPADEQIEAGIARYFTRTSAAALVWPLPDHGFDTRAHLVKAPVTLIWGADDQIVPPSYATLFGDALANVSARHVVANAGHLVEWDQPSAVAALVKSAIG